MFFVTFRTPFVIIFYSSTNSVSSNTGFKRMDIYDSVLGKIIDSLQGKIICSKPTFINDAILLLDSLQGYAWKVRCGMIFSYNT